MTQTTDIPAVAAASPRLLHPPGLFAHGHRVDPGVQVTQTSEGPEQAVLRAAGGHGVEIDHGCGKRRGEINGWWCMYLVSLLKSPSTCFLQVGLLPPLPWPGPEAEDALGAGLIATG